MKRILLLLTILTVTIATTNAATWRLKTERTVYYGPSGAVVTNAVALSWLPQVAPQPTAYEVQRKLFPWGWRKLATVSHGNAAWVDRNPAKRPAFYRVRAIYEHGKSKWSGKAYID